MVRCHDHMTRCTAPCCVTSPAPPDRRPAHPAQSPAATAAATPCPAATPTAPATTRPLSPGTTASPPARRRGPTRWRPAAPSTTAATTGRARTCTPAGARPRHGRRSSTRGTTRWRSTGGRARSGWARGAGARGRHSWDVFVAAAVSWHHSCRLLASPPNTTLPCLHAAPQVHAEPVVRQQRQLWRHRPLHAAGVGRQQQPGLRHGHQYALPQHAVLLRLPLQGARWERSGGGHGSGRGQRKRATTAGARVAAAAFCVHGPLPSRPRSGCRGSPARCESALVARPR